MALPPAKHLFTVEAYEAMAERGIFQPDDRVELLAGEIVEMSPIGTRHAATVNRLTRLFITALGDRAMVAIQNPVALPPYSEPEPDVAIVRGCDEDYLNAHPRPADVLLLIEVADSSLLIDRNVKVPIYAQAGIPELWIVDLTNYRIETYCHPSNGRYATIRTLHRRETLTPSELPELTFQVDQLLPPT
ncbi:MAG TPA: Uma2 family endonuclease [Candidatus Baltobacteraceae bacterium]|nr:Uma2 family endonuclease [Candidatus Baltobacteraceae bacterium]